MAMVQKVLRQEKNSFDHRRLLPRCKTKPGQKGQARGSFDADSSKDALKCAPRPAISAKKFTLYNARAEHKSANKHKRLFYGPKGGPRVKFRGPSTRCVRLLDRRNGGPFGIRIDGNDFQIGQRVGRRCDFEEAIVGAVLRMFPAGTRGDAQSGFAPLHANFQRLREDDQVINLCFHGLTIPPESRVNSGACSVVQRQTNFVRVALESRGVVGE